MNGNVVIRGKCSYVCCLSKADKHVPYGELVGTVQQKYNDIDESSHKQKSL
jgi:hypothetical protein